MIKRTMIMLTRTVYVHCEEAGPTPLWRRSRWVCPAVSTLTAVSHQNRRVYRAAPCRTPTIYATTKRRAWTPTVQRGWTHIGTPLHYIREMQTIFSMIIETKTYNTKVVWNSVVKLLAKENFINGSYATNLTKFGQIGFKRNWSLHQTKLETDG
jgi:hypothetical protein